MKKQLSKPAQEILDDMKKHGDRGKRFGAWLRRNLVDMLYLAILITCVVFAYVVVDKVLDYKEIDIEQGERLLKQNNRQWREVKDTLEGGELE